MKKKDFQMCLILCYKIFSSLKVLTRICFLILPNFFGTKIFFKNEANYQRQIMKKSFAKLALKQFFYLTTDAQKSYYGYLNIPTPGNSNIKTVK